MRNSVDLPDPDSPTIPSVPPLPTDKVTFLTAGGFLLAKAEVSKDLVRSLSTSIVMGILRETSSACGERLRYRTRGRRCNGRLPEHIVAQTRTLPAIHEAGEFGRVLPEVAACARQPRAWLPAAQRCRDAEGARKYRPPALLQRHGPRT